MVGNGRRSYTNYQSSPQIIYPTTYSKPVADPSGQRTQTGGEPKSLKTNKEKQTFTPIPIPYKDLFVNLLEERLISPIFLTPLQPPYPAWYDPSAYCEYHAGIPGHSIENCIAFKKRVQDLINQNVIQLNTSQRPNVANNPLRAHDEPRVNAVINDGGIKIKTSISEVSSSLKWVWEMMIGRGLVSSRPKVTFNHNEVFCEFHWEMGHEIQKCDEFRRFVQDLMDNKEVEFFEQSHEIRDVFVLEEQSSKMSYGVGRPFMINVPRKKEEVPEKPPPRLVIEAPSPFPYKNSRQVPWIYGCNMIAPKREVSET
ncbi:hypothetical protein V6N12_031575 [Hibiscus sabdariffa]|uniref:Gag-pol polyprotein n=1 Tax=Hibiscus sabdariffa TaxID=183260 RepID=A0ABR2DUV2_9ROSI